MANTNQARKRARQSEKRRQHNVSQRSMMRTHIKKVLHALEEKSLDKAKEAYKLVTPILDSLARKGLLHKNKAARHKSRLNAHIKSLETAK